MFGTSRIIEYFPTIILPAVAATLRMLAFSLFFGTIIGVFTAIVLYMYSPYGLTPNIRLYKVLDFIINMLRSFPAIILIVAMTPVTRIVMGTSIGEKAAILPLTVASFPVIARFVESSLLEVDKNVVLAAKSFCANNRQIVFKVLFVEALPSIVSGLTTTTILFLATTTLAGAVGAGGLGAIALTYGYQRFDDIVMYTVVLILFIMVLVIQGIGQFIYKKTK